MDEVQVHAREEAIAVLKAPGLIPRLGSATGVPVAILALLMTCADLSAQSIDGARVFAERCASCHSDHLQGGESATALVGDSFEAGWNGLTVGDLFERTRISMPQDKPGSLSRQQVADVLAFVFEVNKFPKGEKELDKALPVLKTIKLVMPKPSS